MYTQPSAFPDQQTLTAALTSILSKSKTDEDSVKILKRKPAVYISTFPSEIITCRTADGNRLCLLCKYSGDLPFHTNGHRGGVEYEARVYRDALQNTKASLPAFYGTHTDNNQTWLVLEYLDGSVRVNKTPDPDGMGLAARWIGQFHASCEERPTDKTLSFLNTYDLAYYREWARRTAAFTRPLQSRFPWLVRLCERFEACLPSLFKTPSTLIHGEYYPKNILFQDGIIYPVDWESAAIGAGEIDLASLTEEWPADTVAQCKTEYRQARWPQGAPEGFETTLAAARLYWHFRWLGDQSDWTTDRSILPRFEQLRRAGESSGLI